MMAEQDRNMSFNYPVVDLQLAQTSPDQATLEGSSCTDIMTCIGGCGYSF